MIYSALLDLYKKYYYIAILLCICVANDTVGQRRKLLSIVIVLQLCLAEMKFDQHMQQYI